MYHKYRVYHSPIPARVWGVMGGFSMYHAYHVVMCRKASKIGYVILVIDVIHGLERGYISRFYVNALRIITFPSCSE